MQLHGRKAQLLYVKSTYYAYVWSSLSLQYYWMFFIFKRRAMAWLKEESWSLCAQKYPQESFSISWKASSDPVCLPICSQVWRREQLEGGVISAAPEKCRKMPFLGTFPTWFSSTHATGHWRRSNLSANTEFYSTDMKTRSACALLEYDTSDHPRKRSGLTLNFLRLGFKMAKHTQEMPATVEVYMHAPLRT